MLDGQGSKLYSGRTLTDVIEQQKAEDRKQYLHRQELNRQQEERAAAAIKAAEKTPYEEILDRQEAVKKFIDDIQVGDPRIQTFIILALKEICEIMDFCLIDKRPEDNSEE